MEYKEIEKEIIDVLDKTLYGTLATASKNGIVSASQVCLVNDNLKVFIQTDKSFEKVTNIIENPNIAINCGAYYFKGIATLKGHPCENKNFIQKLKIKHPRTYKLYTNLPNEVLVEIQLTECKIWDLKNQEDLDNKYIATINFKTKIIKLTKCETC